MEKKARKERGYSIYKKGNNENFSPIFTNKELNVKLDIYCGITNQSKTKYCEKIILEKVTEDIEKAQKLILANQEI